MTIYPGVKFHVHKKTLVQLLLNSLDQMVDSVLLLGMADVLMEEIWTFYERRIKYTLLRNVTNSVKMIKIVKASRLEQMECSDVLLL